MACIERASPKPSSPWDSDALAWPTGPTLGWVLGEGQHPDARQDSGDHGKEQETSGQWWDLKSLSFWVVGG